VGQSTYDAQQAAARTGNDRGVNVETVFAKLKQLGGKSEEKDE
jgi:hypothetical protein